MKKLTVLFVLFCLPLVLFAQNKQLKKAVKQGKHPQHKTYSVEFKKYHKQTKVDAWMKQNGYSLLLSSTADFPVFGDAKIGYSKLYFMTYPDYIAFVDNARRLAYEERQKQQLQQKQNQGSLLDWIVPTAITVGGVAVLLKGISELFSSGSGSGYSGYSSGSGSSTQENKSSNTTAGKPIAKACVNSVNEYGQAYLRCNAKVKDPYYEVKCGNGDTSFFYHIPVANTSGLCSDQVGYYKPKSLFIGSPRTYLGNDREKALRKLCGCD